MSCLNMKQWCTHMNTVWWGNRYCVNRGSPPQDSRLVGYVLATSNVKSGWVSTCESVPWLGLDSTSSLGNQATSTMTSYWANQSLSYPINAERLARKQQVSILIVIDIWLGTKLLISRMRGPCSTDSATVPSVRHRTRHTDMVHWQGRPRQCCACRGGTATSIFTILTPYFTTFLKHCTEFVRLRA